MPRSLKKGPFVDDHLAKKVEVQNAKRDQERDQDLVASLDDRARHDRPHHRGARRPQARAGLRDRLDGGPQARGVRAHADLPGPHQGRPEVRAGAEPAADADKEAETDEQGQGLASQPPQGAARRPSRFVRHRATGPDLPDQGPPGRRPGPRHGRRRRPEHASVRAAGGQRAGLQGDRERGDQRRADRQPQARRAVRVAGVRGRGRHHAPDPSAGQGQRQPDPQAVQPHHRRRRAARRGVGPPNRTRQEA